MNPFAGMPIRQVLAILGDMWPYRHNRVVRRIVRAAIAEVRYQERRAKYGCPPS